MANTIETSTELWETARAQTAHSARKAGRASGTEKTETEDGGEKASVKTDTVEFSSAAIAALSRSETQVQPAARTNTDSTAQAATAATAEVSADDTAAQLQSSVSIVTSENTYDLSSYTVDELEDMLDEGTITQSEYNAELARREQEEAAAEEQSSQNDTALAAE